MKCVSCETDIDPKWRHAIEMNICPFCGKPILEQHLKNLLTVLADTMKKLEEYPNQVNDWLFSNYNYIKTDSPNIVEYIPKEYMKEIIDEEKEKEFRAKKERDKSYTVKVKTGNGEEEEVQVEKTQSEEETNEFFKRAEAIKPRLDGFKSAAEKTEHLKKLTDKIKKAGIPFTSESGEFSSQISPEMMNNVDPNEVAELEAELSGGIASSISDSSIDDEDDLPPAVEFMLSKTKTAGGYSNEKDLATLHKMQAKINESKKAIRNGKGGFSRA